MRTREYRGRRNNEGSCRESIMDDLGWRRAHGPYSSMHRSGRHPIASKIGDGGADVGLKNDDIIDAWLLDLSR
eukprot:scaffold16312_cov59-Cylindrotheca_fusiformis.AAC.2